MVTPLSGALALTSHSPEASRLHENRHDDFSRKIGSNSTLAFFVSGPERNPNGVRTDPERIPNGPRTDPERTPHGPRMDPVRPSNRSRTDPEQTPRGPRANPARTPNGLRTDPERTPNGPPPTPHRPRVEPIYSETPLI